MSTRAAAGAPPPAICGIVGAIAEIRRWKAWNEAHIADALAEIEEEEQLVAAQLAEARRRLTALALVRREHEALLERLQDEERARESAAIRAEMARDRAIVEARGLLVDRALAERDERLAQAVATDPALRAPLADLELFRDVERSIDTVPAAYRRTLADRRQRARRQLEPLVATAEVQPRPVGGPVGVCVIVSTEPAGGIPEALVVVMPVPFDVHAAWSARKEDLAAWMAYRVVGAVFTLLASLGVAEAPVSYIDVHGSLALQVWLGDHAVDEGIRARIVEQVRAATRSAPELVLGGIVAEILVVRPDLLTGPEGP